MVASEAQTSLQTPANGLSGITVTGLNKCYPQQKSTGNKSIEAVKDVSFEVAQEEFLAIVGRSGSGKSTLLAMLGGLSRPTSGSIKLGETELWDKSTGARADFRNQSVGFVFQFASLLPALRAIDNVALPGLVSGKNDQAVYARARILLQQVGLGTRTDAYPGQLSGGEQRRVAIARAMINSPQILLADEPTADLDEETETEILNLLIDFQRAYKLTLIVVTHNKDIASRADRVLTMKAGQAEANSEILAEHANSVVATKDSISSASSSANLSSSASSISTSALTSASSSTSSATSVSTSSSTSALSSNSASSSTSARADREAERTAAIKNLLTLSNEKIAGEKVSLGIGFDKLVGRFIILLIPVMAIIYLSNLAVAGWQQSIINAKLDQQQALEDLAMSDLKAGVRDIRMLPNKAYEITLFLKNAHGDKPMYLMKPAVRLFIQMGSAWQEVELKAVDQWQPPVSELNGERLLRFTLRPTLAGYSQLIPYYMHVRITNNMLVSSVSQPKDDLIERNDSYYVYLRPHGIDDKTISAKMTFAEGPPVFIPMPPH